MQNGFICGARGALCGRSKSQMPVESDEMYRAPFMNIFVHDSGGFTTVAMATTLLVVLALLFSLVSVGQVLTDSYETQSIADAGALAGENVVAKYTTVATVLDACVLSMGLTGIVALGAGLITSCVPGLQAAGAKLSQTGSSILKARRDFSQSVVKGLQSFEKIMPALIAAQSYACIRSNSNGSLHYTGAALPFPLQSKSEFGSLDSDINDEELTKKSKEIQDKKKLRRRQMKQKRGHGEQIAVIPLRFVCTRGHTLSPCSTGKAILSITLLRHGHLVLLLCALGHITRREKYRRLLGELPEKKGTIQPAEKFFTNTHMKKFAAGLIEKMRMVRSNVHFPNCLVTCKK